MESAISHEDETQDQSPWAWSRWMLEQILVYEAEIASGLTRRLASVLSRWLWSAEGVVRRLLLAAAFALDVTLPARRPARPSVTQEKSAADPAAPDAASPAFRVFSIRRGPSAPAPAPARQPAPHDAPPEASRASPVIGVLPSDPLLRLGFETAPRRSSRVRAASKAGPGRLSRWHPQNLFGGHDPQKDLSWLYHGRSTHDGRPYWEREAAPKKNTREHPWDSRPLPAPPRKPPVSGLHRPIFPPLPDPVGDALNDPALYPAPGLARRIAALAQVLAAPDAAIARLARALARHAQDLAPFAGIGPPAYARRTGDRIAAPPGVGEIALAHLAYNEALGRRVFADSS